MKRRDFIKITAATIPVVGAAKLSAENRLYGTPDSINEKLKINEEGGIALPLTNAQLPPDVMSDVQEFARAWSKVLSDPRHREEVMRAPEKALSRLAPRSNTSNQVATMMAMWDPVIISAIERRDYKAYLEQLRLYLAKPEEGYVAPSRVEEINEAIQQRGLALKESYNGMRNKPIIGEFVEGEELSFIAASSCGPPEVVAAAAVVVVVGALAVTYVSVGVNISVGINVGVYINIAAQVSVAGAGPYSADVHTNNDVGTAIWDSSVPTLSTLQYYELLSAAKAASQAGDRKSHQMMVKELLKREVDIAFKAAEDLEYVHIHPDHRAEVIEAATNYVMKTIGLSSAK